MTEKNDRWKPLLNDAVDYEQTVKALLAFAAFIVHEGDSRRPGSQFGFGRRMTSSDRVVQSFSNIQYYDAPPPSLLILEQLWSNYFPSTLQAATYDEKLKATPILVSVKAAAEEFGDPRGSGAFSARPRSISFAGQHGMPVARVGVV